ncbi:hypothetical protein AXG93_3256s1470 [Marchantia polymorpha subsp. ruderalis]|uniref:Nucleoside phosphorylase domain-containing protein n=1 Tax=Marchantia polymorpha subsp. ruderalis TaxID=1480154 RepID=A0A176VJ50_MARPO|nr:hypothetical protein AXG93_3256s1470 [Marchantia polymorpha subsp. ruderalis]
MAPPALKESPLPDTPISTVLLVIALHAEAAPLVADLRLTQDSQAVFPEGVPWVKYSGTYEGLNVHIVTPGKDGIHGCDPVGTVPASLLTFNSIQVLKPDLIINCGTAGGFQGYREYGVGALEATPVPKLISALQLKTGVLTTGDSLDHVPEDVVIMKANDATVKDMEVCPLYMPFGGAAIAYVAHLLSVPLIMLKGVTDIVDSPAATDEEFLANLSLTAHAIQRTVSKALQFISGKKLSDLQ